MRSAGAWLRREALGFALERLERGWHALVAARVSLEPAMDRLTGSAPMVAALGLWLLGPGGAGMACGGCQDPASLGEGKPSEAGFAKPVTTVVPRPLGARRMHDLDLSPTMVALQSGAKVWMWADGRSNAISYPIDSVSWSERGFEFETANGLARVLAPGGGLYYRAGRSALTPARPLREMLQERRLPPAGFDVRYIAGAGGSRVQAVLVGPEERRVRLGLFQGRPDAQIWLRGKLPERGKPSPAVSGDWFFERDADGRFAGTPPEGAEPQALVPVPPERSERWLAVAQAFRKDGEPLTLGASVYMDLDQDGESESVLCLDGSIGMLEPRCVVVDEVDGEARLYAAGLPWVANGNPPIVFTMNGAPYLLMVSPEEPSVAFVLRYYGAGWIVEPLQ